jgi:hypothetical protein
VGIELVQDLDVEEESRNEREEEEIEQSIQQHNSSLENSQILEEPDMTQQQSNESVDSDHLPTLSSSTSSSTLLDTTPDVDHTATTNSSRPTRSGSRKLPTASSFSHSASVSSLSTPPIHVPSPFPHPSPSTLTTDSYEDDSQVDDVESFVCLNEVIVDRGLSAYLTQLDCYIDGMLFTRVQADGIIIATPTGSTAYSLSAGGSMCQPQVPTILFTPVCPHSLSFRPLLFPDTSTLQIKVSPDSRGANCASFDGRHRATLNPGDSLLISMSRWPLPSICRLDGTTDW